MTNFILRHKLLTVFVWLVFGLAGVLTAGKLKQRLDYTYTTPGQSGWIANQHILDRFGIDATFEPFLAVLHLPAGSGMDTSSGREIAARTFASASGVGNSLITNGTDPVGVSAEMPIWSGIGYTVYRPGRPVRSTMLTPTCPRTFRPRRAGRAQDANGDAAANVGRPVQTSNPHSTC